MASILRCLHQPGIATYFRKEFVADNVADVTNLTWKLVVDDGAAVYLNGTPLVLLSPANNPASHNTLARPDQPQEIGGRLVEFFQLTSRCARQRHGYAAAAKSISRPSPVHKTSVLRPAALHSRLKHAQPRPGSALPLGRQILLSQRRTPPACSKPPPRSAPPVPGPMFHGPSQASSSGSHQRAVTGTTLLAIVSINRRLHGNLATRPEIANRKFVLPHPQILVQSDSRMSQTHPLTTTTFELPGYRVTKSFGVVRGIIVRSRSIIGNFGAGLQSLFGGNITIYTSMCERARDDAFNQMIAHAGQLGANAVIGVRYDATEVAAGITEVLCYGLYGNQLVVMGKWSKRLPTQSPGNGRPQQMGEGKALQRGD